jgi:hypothetical protein
MLNEYNALMHNMTWTLVPLVSGHKIIDCKWAYKVKLIAAFLYRIVGRLHSGQELWSGTLHSVVMAAKAAACR